MEMEIMNSHKPCDETKPFKERHKWTIKNDKIPFTPTKVHCICVRCLAETIIEREEYDRLREVQHV